MSVELNPEFEKEVAKHEQEAGEAYDESRRESDFTYAKGELLDDLRKSQMAKDSAENRVKKYEDEPFMAQGALMGLDIKEILSGSLKKRAEKERQQKIELTKRQAADADLSLEGAAAANAILEQSFKTKASGDPVANALETLAARKAAAADRLKRATDAGSDENVAIAAAELRTLTAAEGKLRDIASHQEMVSALRKDQDRGEAQFREMVARAAEARTGDPKLGAALEDAERRAAALSDEYQKKYEGFYEEDEGFKEAEALNELTGAIQGVFARARNEDGPAAKVGYVLEGLKKLKEREQGNPEALELIEEVESRLK